MLSEQRKNRITASLVGAILGVAPYMKRSDAMRLMVREYHNAPREFEGNIATEYGSFNEDNAKFDFELKGFEVKPSQFYISGQIDWLGATPDGEIGDDALLEIKCPYGQRDAIPPKFKTAEQQPHYYAQMQIQMFCAKKTRCYFYQWSQHGDALEVVELNNFWLEENLPKIAEFYGEFLEEVKNHDQYLCDEIEAPELAAAYQAAKAHVELAQAQLEKAKQALIDRAGGNKCTISGLLVCPVEREGSVSYAKALKDLAPGADLSAYKGKPSSYWVIK